MHTPISTRNRFGLSVASAALVAGVALAGSAHGATKRSPTIIELTQVGCQFVETENGVDHGFKPKSADDCKAINAKTGDERLEKAKVLSLEPGNYVFRVTNKNIPYQLGFWLRGDGIVGRASLPGVSGGGLTTGTTKDYAVKLEPGEYLYSCPLNPTPNYRLIVKG